MLTRIAIVSCILMGCGDSAETRSSEDATEVSDGVPQEVAGGDVSTADAAIDGDFADGDVVPDGADATSPPDVPLADAAGDPAGTACSDGDSCRSGWCVPSAIGQVCVDLCSASCDAGQACIPAADAGTDPVNLCVPIVAPPGTDTIGGDATEVTDDTHDATSGDATSGDATDASANDIDDDASTTDAGPGPDVPAEETIGGDQDGDGIPDDEDNLPCLAVYLVVYNDDVTSASIELNGSEVVDASSFPTSEPITVTINPSAGENSLALGGQLTGSPSDTLTLVVIDASGHVYFATVIAREPGKPMDKTFTFTLDVTCP